MKINYSKTPLIVIDMQEAYYPSTRRKGVLKAVAREIKDAVKRNALVFFIEFRQYRDCGTYQSLLNLTKKHDRMLHCEKFDVDGSDVICDFAEVEGVDLSRFKRIKVCGVEANCCVQETVWGLASLLQDSNIIFEVVEDAVANPPNGGWRGPDITWKHLTGQQGNCQIKRKKVG